MILPVILAGGSGERLWPLSRTSYPKQFLSLSNNQPSLFQNTIQRLPINANIAPPLIVCHEDYRFIVAEQLRQIDHKPYAIILEPCAKNTAPAITAACLWAQKHCGNATLLVMPCDHLIGDSKIFYDTVEAAKDAVENGALVTFGIPIKKPETGYGYIKTGPNNSIVEFIEKPDILRAQQFAANPQYLWNSGIFFFKAEVFLAELKTHHPQIIDCISEAMSVAVQDLDFIRLPHDQYTHAQSISIDYAVMENTKKAQVFALNCAWSDIGNWQAVWEHNPKDAAGNVIRGQVIAHNSQDCLLMAQHRLIAVNYLKDIMVIETPDAVLISDKNHAQEVRAIIAQLKEQKHVILNDHQKTRRPWGFYECLAKGANFQVKHIVVNPHSSLSLQAHKFRSEHWVVVSGSAQVRRGDEVLHLSSQESTFIPQGVKHQLRNNTKEALHIIEVQCGSYLGEDDIIRYADDYGRVVKQENAT